ncbi:MAG TPA: hypothetical protein PKC58_17940, partial [Ignavibacteria bacterium]|nr:hypothetical protein [Ignavibacteria bacterium]
MKKIFLLFFALFFASRVNSQIFIENFDYAPNTQISTTPLWYVANNSALAPITAAIPGLTFPDYIGSGIGNMGYIPSSPQTSETDSASLVPSVSSGAVYSSFMIRTIGVGTSPDRVFYSLQGSDNQIYGSVYWEPTGNSDLYRIGIQKAGGDAVVYYNRNLVRSTQTYLVIVKYEFKTGSGSDDEVSLFVYDIDTPVPSVEPAPDLGPITSASPDAPNLSRVLLNNSINGPDLYIDGIYVDQAWNSGVLPVELASFTSSVINRDVTLYWKTTSETNNSAFE